MYSFIYDYFVFSYDSTGAHVGGQAWASSGLRMLSMGVAVARGQLSRHAQHDGRLPPLPARTCPPTTKAAYVRPRGRSSRLLGVLWLRCVNVVYALA